MSANPETTRRSAVVFITGASRGLGRALVEEALEEGMRVVAGYRNLSSSTSFSSHFGPERFLAVELDVTVQDQIDAATRAAVERFGVLDVFINNAGYSDIASIEQTSLDDFRLQMETNLFGVIACTKAVLPLMRKRRDGHIIQISSVAGQLGPAGRGPYAAAKWAVEGFSEVLASEVSSFGVKVTIVEPGGFRTDFAAKVSAGEANKVMADYKPSVGRMLDFQSNFSGKQPGDPKKAAKAIIHISQMAKPPLRVALGTDAFEAIEAKHEERRDERHRFKTLSRSMALEDSKMDLSNGWKDLSL